MQNKMSSLIFIAMLTLSYLRGAAQEPSGVWLTQDKDAKIEIYKTSSGSYEGKIIWVKSNKPEAQKKVGVKILSTFKKKDGKTYESGTIFHPDQNKNYSGIITMKSKDILHLRGYIGAPLLGQTQTWTRVK